MKAARFVFNTFLLMLASIGVSLSFAHADEVELTPSSSFYLDTTLTQGNTSTRVNALSNRDSGTWQYYYKPWLAGPYLANGESRIAYNPPQMSNSDLSSLGTVYDSTYAFTGLNLYNSGVGSNSKVPAFTLDIDSATAILYVDSLTAGWYRYELDFYVGVGIVVNNNSSGQGIAQTLNPSFTYLSPDPYQIGSVNGTIQYLGTIDGVKTGNDYMIGTQLLHFKLVDTWEVDPSAGNYTWNMQPFFQYVISSLSYAGTLDCYRSYVLTTNNRFVDKLYGNVTPIIPTPSPTPSPTPYPGQDTQESINAGVSQIESQVSQLTNILDVHATPVPVPEELTIDETVIDVLETMTLPDLEDSRSTMSTMWEIFTPAVWFLSLLAAAIFVVSIFLWILRGGWL